MCHGLVGQETFMLHVYFAYLQSHLNHFVLCSRSDVVEIYNFLCHINAIYISILFRAIPGCLGSLGHFKSKFSDPIEQGQRHSATKRSLATGRKTVRALVRKISHWFLRRNKALIKGQLPKKDDRVRSVKSSQTLSCHYCNIGI